MTMVRLYGGQVTLRLPTILYGKPVRAYCRLNRNVALMTLVEDVDVTAALPASFKKHAGFIFRKIAPTCLGSFGNVVVTEQVDVAAMPNFLQTGFPFTFLLTRHTFVVNSFEPSFVASTQTMVPTE